MSFDDLRRDIEDHIDRETRDNLDRGMSPQAARAAALRKFGNRNRIAARHSPNANRACDTHEIPGLFPFIHQNVLRNLDAVGL